MNNTLNTADNPTGYSENKNKETAQDLYQKLYMHMMREKNRKTRKGSKSRAVRQCS